MMQASQAKVYSHFVAKSDFS